MKDENEVFLMSSLENNSSGTIRYSISRVGDGLVTYIDWDGDIDNNGVSYGYQIPINRNYGSWNSNSKVVLAGEDMSMTIILLPTIWEQFRRACK